MIERRPRGSVLAEAATHDWLIEPREVARHEERRGRRHAYERIDPRRTALVVVDMVRFFVEKSAYCRGIVPKVNLLAETLRASGGTVCWVVPGYTPPSAVTREFFGDAVAESYAGSGGQGEPVERLWHELAVARHDAVVEKTARSAFFPGTSHTHELLTSRGIDTVVVTGTVTNVCVEATVRDASTLGYRVVLVADACAAMRDRDHNATLHVVYRSYGDVRSTEDVVRLIRAA
jgi:nicotinamidase-related amidase